MIFSETRLKGAYIIDPDRFEDERGFFARTYCQREFESHGIRVDWVQCNISYNQSRGTLRGMHYQAAPYEEGKLIRCTMGAIHDAIIDLRPESPTFKGHFAIELSAQNRRMIFVPEGFAHGFLTLVDSTEIFYHMSEFYVPGHSQGVRWNDPTFAIEWPIEVQVISPRDQNYPDFTG